MDHHSTITSETQSLLENRVSVRKFSDKPVSEDMIDALLKAAFRAPTSSNIQAYSVVVVREPETKNKLAAAAGNQKHVMDTPVFLAFCADLTRLQDALARSGNSLAENNMEMGILGTVDATLVGMAASLVGESFGLQGVMIGGMRNDPQRVAEILGLPKQVYCVFGMCLGFPDEAPKQKPRMEQAAMVHYERYGVHRDERSAAEMISAYDEALAAHYASIDKPTTAASWTDEIGAKFAPQPRPGLREALKNRGFDFS